MKNNLLQFALLLTFLSLTGIVQAQWQCGDPITDTRDGQVYRTVLIGNQCWLKDNLNYGKMIQNTAAGHLAHDDGIVEKFCWNNDTDFCYGTHGKEKKGGYYEWQEALQYYGTTPPSLPVKGICPTGWHIPSDAEWNILFTTLGGLSVAGDKMKTTGSSGFDGALIGYRCTAMGNFRPSAMYTLGVYYWTSYQTDASNARFYGLEQGMAAIWTMDYSKSLGLSVRCIKDAGTSTGDLQNIEPAITVTGITPENDNRLNIHIISRFNSEINITLVDMEGREVKTMIYNVIKGNNTINLDRSLLASGTYVLKITCSGHQVVNKLMIQ